MAPSPVRVPMRVAEANHHASGRSIRRRRLPAPVGSNRWRFHWLTPAQDLGRRENSPPDSFPILLTLALLTALTFQCPHAISQLGRDTRTLAVINCGLGGPLVHGLERMTDLHGNRQDFLPPQFMLALMVESQTHGAFAHFGGSFFVVSLMMPDPAQKLEPSANPARFNTPKIPR